MIRVEADDRLCEVCGRQPCTRGKVCDGDRRRLDRVLSDIGTTYGRLLEIEEPPAASWTVRQKRTVKGQEKWVTERGHDPIAADLPSGPTKEAAGPKVSGSRTPPVPVDLARLDLATRAGKPTADTMLPATRLQPVKIYHRYITLVDGEPHIVTEQLHLKQRTPIPGQTRPAGDQIGLQPVKSVLALMVKDWWERGFHDQRPPRPTKTKPAIRTLTTWLQDRLDWACDHHPDIADIADQLHSLLHTMRAALGELPAQPELCQGVACKSCDARTLFREPPWIVCHTCGTLLSTAEYDEWCKLLAAAAQRLNMTTDTPTAAVLAEDQDEALP